MRTMCVKRTEPGSSPDLANSARTRSSSVRHVCETSCTICARSSSLWVGISGRSTWRSKRYSNSAQAQPKALKPAAHSGTSTCW